MAEKKSNITNRQFNELKQGLDGLKADNLTQFGEIKKEFGNTGVRLDNHQKRLTDLEEDKIKRDAIEQYKKAHPEVAQKVFDTGQKGYNENASGLSINKDLLKAIMQLLGVIGVLVAAILALKAK